MSAFVDPTDLIDLHHSAWDTDEHVWIKAKMSRADQQAVKATMIDLHISADGTSDGKVAMAQAEDLIMSRMIVRWTLKLKDGSVAPLTDTSIGDLDAQSSSYIYDEINRRNPLMGQDERDAFLSKPDTSTKELATTLPPEPLNAS